MSMTVKRHTVLWLAVVMLVGGAAIAFLPGSQSRAQGAPSSPTVKVLAAQSQVVSDWEAYSGRLEALESVDIRPRVAGALLSVHFKDGQQVKQGDLLFTIDPAPFEAESKKAQAALAQARDRQHFTASEMQRGQRLLNTNAISQRDFDALENAAREARSAVEAAQAAADRAKLDVSYTRITSPISGRISRAEVTRGNVIAAGGDATPLASVVSVDAIYASFNADEQTYLRYFGSRAAGGTPQVDVGLAGENGYPHTATLHSVDNQLDTRSGTIRMRALLKNGDGRMIPGLQARVRVQASTPYQAVLVDESSIATDQDRRFVLVVGQGEKVEYRRLELGSRQGSQRVVLQGLASGERVIVNGAQRVKAGDVVQISAMATGATATTQ